MKSKPATELLTTRETADHFGTAEWRVRRLFEDGMLPEPPRFGGKRAIARAAAALPKNARTCCRFTT